MAIIEELKKRFTKDPVLFSFNQERPSIIETNTLNAAIGAAHLQHNNNRKLHPIVYYSKKYLLAK